MGSVVSMGNNNTALSGGSHTVPISALTPYSNRWTIKVRVTSKGPVKTWTNNRGSGSMFKVELLDESSGEISATFFQNAVNMFYDRIDVNKVYYMSGGRVKVADSRYSNGRTYEINFDDKAIINNATDDASIKQATYNFSSIASISDIEPNRTIDVLGVITNVGESASINTKTNRTTNKRDLTIVDNSNASINMTIWGDKAASTYDVGAVILVKGVRVSDWSGRSLATQLSSNIETNPDIPEAHALRGWYEHGGKSSAVHLLSDKGNRSGSSGDGVLQGPLLDISQRYTVASLKDEQLGAGEGTLAIVKASVKFIKNEIDKIMYPGCKNVRDNRVCNKRLDKMGDTTWMCTNCGPQAEPDYRYMLTIVIQDATGDQFVTLFNAEAEQLLGVKANDLRKYADNNTDPTSVPEYTQYFSNALWREGLFSIRCKMNVQREEAKIQQNVMKLRILGEGDSYVRESKALLENIRKYLA